MNFVHLQIYVHSSHVVEGDKLAILYITAKRFDKCTIIVYAHGRRLCCNWFRHGSTTISYPQCSLTFLRERYWHSHREQSFAVRAHVMSAVGIDVVSVHKLFAYRIMSTVSIDIVSSHTKYRRIAYSITRQQNALQGTNE